MIDYTQKPEYLQFIHGELGTSVKYSTLAQVNNGVIEAVVGFNNCSKSNIEISIATRQGCVVTRSLIKACAIYAFIQCGVLRITNIARFSNVKSQEFSKRLGFVEEFSPIINWFGINDNGIQFVMFRDDCRWIKGKQND
jgi:AAA15 family ATPase/GTPase